MVTTKILEKTLVNGNHRKPQPKWLEVHQSRSLNYIIKLGSRFK